MTSYDRTFSNQTERFPDFSRATQCLNSRALSADSPNHILQYSPQNSEILDATCYCCLRISEMLKSPINTESARPEFLRT